MKKKIIRFRRQEKSLKALKDRIKQLEKTCELLELLNTQLNDLFPEGVNNRSVFKIVHNGTISCKNKECAG